MKTWETKDGEILEIKNMSTSHIMHCVKMLEKSNSTRIVDEVFEQGAWVDDIGHSDNTEKYIDAFEAELEKRKEVEKLWI